MAEVAHVDTMAGDAEEGEEDGEMVHEDKEELDGDNGVDETGQEFTSQDRMFFNQFGEVVEAARCARC